MPDNFVEGETFDGETGYKTGAQLEDLIAEAQLAQNDAGTNRIYDNSSIDTTANGDGNRMLQVKAGGLDTSHFTGGAFIYPRLTLLGGIGDWGGVLGFTSWGNYDGSTDPNGEDWANVIDQDETTFPTTALYTDSDNFAGQDTKAPYMKGEAGVYVDLGATYVGLFLFACDFKCSSATANDDAFVGMHYGQATSDLTDNDFIGPGLQIGTGSETSYRPTLGILPFMGRYVGFHFGSIGSGFDGYVKPSRFEVYGATP